VSQNSTASDAAARGGEQAASRNARTMSEALDRIADDAHHHAEDIERTVQRRKVRADDGGSRSSAALAAASPIRMVTSDAVASEVDLLRASCREADLAIERCQRVHDEYFYAQEEAHQEAHDAAHIASLHIESFEDALEALSGIHLPEHVPAALGFAHRTIIAEVASTRANLEDAIRQCCAAKLRMMEILALAGADGLEEYHEHGGDGAVRAGALNVVASSAEEGAVLRTVGALGGVDRLGGDLARLLDM
jgi:predicted transcriptional regulator